MERSPAAVLELRLPPARWIGGYFAGALNLMLGLGILVGAVVAGRQMGWQIGAFLALISGISLALAAHCLRDARAKHGLSIRAGVDGLALRLPAARSLVRTLRAEQRSVLLVPLLVLLVSLFAR